MRSATGRAHSSRSASRSAVEIDAASRKDVLDFTHTVMDAIGRLYKVLPTAVVASAMRPSITRRELEAAGRCRDRHAARQPRQPRRAERRRSGRRGARAARDARHPGRRSRPRARARPERAPVLRARASITSSHPPRIAPTDVRRFEGLLLRALPQRAVEARRVEVRPGHQPTASPAGSSPARRSSGRSRPRARCRRRGCTSRSTTWARASRRSTKRRPPPANTSA